MIFIIYYERKDQVTEFYFATSRMKVTHLVFVGEVGEQEGEVALQARATHRVVQQKLQQRLRTGRGPLAIEPRCAISVTRPDDLIRGRLPREWSSACDGAEHRTRGGDGVSATLFTHAARQHCALCSTTELDELEDTRCAQSLLDGTGLFLFFYFTSTY